MKSLLLRCARALSRRVGKERIGKLILIIARVSEINLLKLALRNIGISKFQDGNASGEYFFITNVLKGCIKPSDFLFDVGANVGNYSRYLREQFPSARIFAFEPNPAAYEALVDNMRNLDVSCFNFGLSSESGKRRIHVYSDQLATEHASIYREVFTDFHHRSDLRTAEFDALTIDEFCRTNDIHHIKFLKIDTEGHELEVLKGATRMISENRVGAIQFEFNEMNVISRVFLRDFYELLPQFKIYRLDSHRMIPLGKYDSVNEIFKFQNLVALGDRIWVR